MMSEGMMAGEGDGVSADGVRRWGQGLARRKGRSRESRREDAPLEIVGSYNRRHELLHPSVRGGRLL